MNTDSAKSQAHSMYICDPSHHRTGARHYNIIVIERLEKNFKYYFHRAWSINEFSIVGRSEVLDHFE